MIRHAFVLCLLVLLNSCAQQKPADKQEPAGNLLAAAQEEILTPPWTTELSPCVPGRKYLFQADLYRERWGSGVYAVVRAWGERKRLNSHLQSGRYQQLEALFTCPDRPKDNPFFIFENPRPGVVFRMKNPTLKPAPAADLDRVVPPFFKDRFGIGFYGVHTVADLETIHRLAANAVILSGSEKKLEEMITACHRLGLAYVLSTPHDPDRIAVFAERIAPLVKPDRLAFYVNDEPEIRSVPVAGVVRTQQLLKQRFPDIATCMATVRPMGAYTYRNGADYFMSDQYPVPSMPMRWLGDSMDEIAAMVGRERLASVIQAFGGGAETKGGWPRLPTWQEMDALAMLSVLHGSRAVFFFTWSYIGKTEASREDIGRVIGRLNHIYPWLRQGEVVPGAKVTMVSRYRYDAAGKPAVQCGVRDHDGQRLLLCVNTCRTHVEALVTAPPGDESGRRWKELFFADTTVREDEGGLHLFFSPYQTRAFTFPLRTPRDRD